MIQRSVSIVSAARLFACALLASCSRDVQGAVPRRLDGALIRGPFVPPSAYEAFVRGELALSEGKYQLARAHFELATTAPEEDALVLSRLALAELGSGDRGAAVQSLEHAMQLDPCSEPAWLARGELAEHDRDLASARAAYERASACAPGSPLGELALARLLIATEPDRALDVLVRAATRREYRSAVNPVLDKALSQADPASLAHALTSLGVQRAPSAADTERAVRLALDRNLPRLALRLASTQPASIDVGLTATLYVRLRAREQLAALLARHDADDLGGHARTAELALEAGAYERAELESAHALAEAPSDPVRATRARALLSLGRAEEALALVRDVNDRKIQRELVLDALAARGAASLARELAAREAVRAQ